MDFWFSWTVNHNHKVLKSKQKNLKNRLKLSFLSGIIGWRGTIFTFLKMQLYLQALTWSYIKTLNFDWLLNLIPLSVRKPQPRQAPVMPYRVCCPWPTLRPLPHLPPRHLPCLFPEDLQRDWGRSREKVAGLCGWLEVPKRQEVLKRSLSSRDRGNDQSSGRLGTSVMRKVRMNRKRWEPVLKTPTMVSSC